MLPIQKEMMVNEEIAIRKTGYYGLTQNRVIALREANLSMFSGEEIAMVDRVLSEFRDMSATEISWKSHRFIGWQLVELNEEIPYEVALVGRRDLTQQQ